MPSLVSGLIYVMRMMSPETFDAVLAVGTRKFDC